MPIFRSLPIKLLVAVLTTVALTLSVGFTLFWIEERRDLTVALEHEAAQDSTVILAGLEQAMGENDQSSVLQTMRTVASTPGVSQVMIADPQGVVRLSTNPAATLTFPGAKGAVCELCHAEKIRSRHFTSTVRKADGTEVLRNIIPILNKQQCHACHNKPFLGLLIADMRTDNLLAHTRAQVRRSLWFALAIFAVITVSLLFVVHLIIRRPIKVFVRGTGEMARGNYEVKLPTDSGDELGYLARSFNEMAEKIKASRTLLERWNASLEEEVENRTRELQTANEQLEHEKTQAESLTHSIIEGVISVDTQGAIVLANPGAADLFGRSEWGLMGQPFASVVQAASPRFLSPEAMEALLLRTPPENEGLIGELNQIEPRCRTFKVSMSRVRSLTGADLGRVFSFHDISREKEIDDIKTNLVAMVSHELRTPLTAIKGSLSLIAGDTPLDKDEMLEFHQIAMTNTDRLIELINNLLDLARIESGKVFFEHGAFLLHPLVDRCIHTVSGFARRNGVILEQDVDSGITEVTGDASKLEQVLVNLLSNAIKFSPDGGNVRIKAERGSAGIRISVSDQGIGVPETEREKIFGKFYQVDMTAVRRVGGSGLGLSICKAVVEGHGGRIWVESNPNAGSTFHFTIPARAQAPVAPEAMSPAAQQVLPYQKIAHRVLVVEDEESVRRILIKYLEERGVEVLEASSAREALDVARRMRPDCITMDVMLPDFNGFDLTAVLKSDPATRDIPVIFLTVLEDEGLTTSRRLGAAAYFTKPVKYERVMEKIESVLGALPSSAGRSVLLVDDEPDVVKPFGAYLRQKGYVVRFAFSGEEALAKLEEGYPDLMILDLRMPRVSGYEILARIKADPLARKLPVIVVTASEEEQSQRRVMEMGAVAFIRKPIMPEHLKIEIEKHIH